MPSSNSGLAIADAFQAQTPHDQDTKLLGVVESSTARLFPLGL